MTLNTAKNIKISDPELFIKRFHDYPIVEKPSAFMFCSNMKALGGSKAEKTVLVVVCSQRRKMRELHCARPRGKGARSLQARQAALGALRMPMKPKICLGILIMYQS